MVTLSPKAREIALKTMLLYPDEEFIFTSNGKPIIADTFNRRLKKVCNTLNIPYRSSHQIRFTTATNLYEAGIPITQLSYELGHSDVRTTFMYTRQRKPDERSKAIIMQVQDL